MSEVPTAPEPDMLTDCARQALAAAGAPGEIVSVTQDGRCFTVELNDDSAASVCRRAWSQAGYRVEVAPTNIFERPAGLVRLRVEPPLHLPDGPDRPTRLTERELLDLRQRAAQEAGRFVDPSIVSKPGPAYHSRDWAQAVLGRELHELDWPTMYLLHIAMEAEPDPPVTSVQAAENAQREDVARAADAERSARAERYAAQDAADAQRWAELVAACRVRVEVRPNATGPGRTRGGRNVGPLRHVVPLVDAVSPRRLHPAGRALCEVTRERQLGEPVNEHATCTSCTTYVGLIHWPRPPPDLPGHPCGHAVRQRRRPPGGGAVVCRVRRRPAPKCGARHGFCAHSWPNAGPGSRDRWVSGQPASTCRPRCGRRPSAVGVL